MFNYNAIMQENKKGLWQRYKVEYKKQNALPLPVWRFWLSLTILLFALAVSLFLIVSGEVVFGLLALMAVLAVAFVVYDKRPDKYKVP